MQRSSPSGWGGSARLALAPLAVLGAALWAREDWSVTRATPTVLRDEGYIGAQACRECHPDNHASWSASYHSRMTQAGSPSAVLAPEPSTTPPLEGVAWRLERSGENVFATPLSLRGQPVGPKERIALVTGSHHYQIYWLEAQGQDELAQLPFVWHLAEGRWVPRKSVFLAPPPPSVFLEGGRWPRTCIKCHTTNGTMRHGSDKRSHVADFGIACEACHGPGERHAAIERERKSSNAPADAPVTEHGIVNPSELDHVRSAQVCGQCHGIHPLDKEGVAQWQTSGFAYRPGEDLAATRALLRGLREHNDEPLRAYLDAHAGTLEELYWSDGQVRVSGREYNGLVESPCFVRGELDCLSCHEMHPDADDAAALAVWADDQLKPGHAGPQACLQCHGSFSGAEELERHTRHAPESSGSDCLNCHMPYTTYGLTKAIRSHTITSPSVQNELDTGRPNACNQCHLDRSLAWAAEELRAGWGQVAPQLDRDRREVAASVLWALTGDAGQRALAAWSLGWDPAVEVSGRGWSIYLLSTLLQDPYDAVRFVAEKSVRRDPRFREFELDFHTSLAEQRRSVQAGVVPRWQSERLIGPEGRGRAVLVLPDGSLDVPRFRELFARQDARTVRLSE